MYFKAEGNYLLAQFFDAEGAAFLSILLVLSVFSSSLSFSYFFEIDPETLWTNKMHWKAMIKGTNTMFFVLTWEKKGHAAENKVVEKGQR